MAGPDVANGDDVALAVVIPAVVVAAVASVVGPNVIAAVVGLEVVETIVVGPVEAAVDDEDVPIVAGEVADVTTGPKVGAVEASVDEVPNVDVGVETVGPPIEAADVTAGPKVGAVEAAVDEAPNADICVETGAVVADGSLKRALGPCKVRSSLNLPFFKCAIP